MSISLTYVDQGYTGTNFNRPAFQKMIRDINLGKVNMVITKDLSRLGRDYIETGEYIEKWFPENNVRYVSVTDGIDTFETSNGNNDIAPLNDNIDQIYVDKLNGKISEEMYGRLFKKLRDESKQKENEYVELKELQGKSKQEDSENIKKIVKDFLELKEPTPEVMKVIINRIEIHQDKQVDIVCNFKQLSNIT